MNQSVCNSLCVPVWVYEFVWTSCVYQFVCTSLCVLVCGYQLFCTSLCAPVYVCQILCTSLLKNIFYIPLNQWHLGLPFYYFILKIKNLEFLTFRDYKNWSYSPCPERFWPFKRVCSQPIFLSFFVPVCMYQFVCTTLCVPVSVYQILCSSLCVAISV